MNKLELIIVDMGLTSQDSDNAMLLDRIMYWEDTLTRVRDEMFTSDDLISFGEYLLSEERRELLFGDEDMQKLVFHVDIENWKAKQ